VAPGYIATEMLEHVPESCASGSCRKSRRQVRAAGRNRACGALPRVVFSSFVTGAVWDVNGDQEM
jgi:hypothetical protein